MDEDLLLGNERLKSYENKSEHYKNLNLIGNITPKIALLELILRNLLDFYLSEENASWIFEDEFADFRQETQKKYKNENLHKYQYLSNLTLGQIRRIIITKKLQARFASFFKIRNFDIRLLYKYNKDKILVSRRRRYLLDINKISIILSLFVSLRNRSFHWENLYKMRGDKPRISTVYRGFVVSLHPSKIEFFLDYFINVANEKFLVRLKENSL